MEGELRDSSLGGWGMARHTGGWVKFWRKAALGDINSNFTRGGLFGALISMANIDKSTVSWNGLPRTLERGQLVTSLRELADLGGVDPKTISKHLAYLVRRETIKIEKCSTGTLITFLKYEDYAGLDAVGSTRPPRGMDNDLHAAWIHNEERKNERRGEGPKPIPANQVFKTKDELKNSVPLLTREKWAKNYPDKEWLENQYDLAFDYHTAEPSEMPRTTGAWMRKLQTWLEIGWKNRRVDRQASGNNNGVVPD